MPDGYQHANPFGPACRPFVTRRPLIVGDGPDHRALAPGVVIIDQTPKIRIMRSRQNLWKGPITAISVTRRRTRCPLPEAM